MVDREPLVGAQLTVRDALNGAMDEEMEKDQDVFILGEEVILVAVLLCAPRAGRRSTSSAGLKGGCDAQ